MNTRRSIGWLTLPTLALAILLIGPGCRSTPEMERGAQKPFNEQISGKTRLSDALVRAQVENKRVLLLFGANWR